MIEKGAKVDAQQKDGTHATFIAAQNGYLEVLQLLIQKDLNVAYLRGEGERTPFDAAFESWHWNILEYLISLSNVKINVADLKGYTEKPLLVAAAIKGHLDVMKYFISQQNVSMNIQNYYGETPLFAAATKCHLDVIEYLASQKNVNIDSKTDGGFTSLNVATKYNCPKGVRLLLEKGADASIKPPPLFKVPTNNQGK